MNNIPLYDRPCFVYLFFYGHLGYFYILGIGNYAAMNMDVQISVWDLALFFNYFIVQLQLSVFTSHHSPPTPAEPTSLPCFHSSPLFYPCVLYSCSWKPFPPLSSPTSPLVTVRLFLISMWDLAFNLGQYIPRSGISGSYFNSVFKFLRNQHTIFP